MKRIYSFLLVCTLLFSLVAVYAEESKEELQSKLVFTPFAGNSFSFK